MCFPSNRASSQSIYGVFSITSRVTVQKSKKLFSSSFSLVNNCWYAIPKTGNQSQHYLVLQLTAINIIYNIDVYDF